MYRNISLGPRRVRLAVVSTLLIVMGVAPVRFSPAAEAAAARSSISTVLSASATSYAGPGKRVVFGQMVTNTGNTYLTGLAAFVSGGGSVVDLVCTPSALAPGASATCTTPDPFVTGAAAEYSFEGAARGRTPQGTEIFAETSSLSLRQFVPGTTPLLATGLERFGGGPFPMNGITYPFDDWKIKGTGTDPSTEEDGVIACRKDSTPWSGVGETPRGVLCDRAPGQPEVLHLVVPTPTVKVPLVCNVASLALPQSVSIGCEVEAFVSGTLNSLGKTLLKCTTVSGPSAQQCDAYGDLVINMNRVDQGIVLRARLWKSAPSLKPAWRANGFQGEMFFEPFVLHAQPSMAVQGKFLVDRIVYQPPGGLSSQSFTVTSGSAAERTVSFGKSDSTTSTKSWGVGLKAEVGFKAETPDGVAVGGGVEINFENDTEWSWGSEEMGSSSSAEENAITLTQTLDETLGTGTPASSDPAEPPWMSDLVVLTVGPQFLIYNMTSCSDGQLPTEIQVDGGTGSACPAGSSVKGSTGVSPLAAGGRARVKVRDLVGCVKGAAASYEVGGLLLSPAECREIVRMDPFAATALGVVPTPVGSSAGQSVDPVAVLGGPSGVLPMAGKDTFTPGNDTSSSTFSQELALKNSYSATSTSAMTTTNSMTNKSTLGINGKFKAGVIELSGGLSVSMDQSLNESSRMEVTYSGSQAFTKSQKTSTAYTVGDQLYNGRFSPYWDPRFNTIMFREPATPSINDARPVAAVADDEVEVGATIDSIRLTGLPVSVKKGQRLQLASGQFLVVAADQRPSTDPEDPATSVEVEPAELLERLPRGSRVLLVGAVAFSISTTPSGRVDARICTDGPTVGEETKCGLVQDLILGKENTTLYADLERYLGKEVRVLLRTRSGTAPYPEVSYQVGTLPAAPTLRSARPMDRAARISWDAPADGGSPILEYQVAVRARPRADFDWQEMSRRVVDASSRSVSIDGLTNGYQYEFTVAASTWAGVGKESAASAIVVPSSTIGAYYPFASWQALIDRQYLDVLGRKPTGDERGSWVARLSAGETVGQLVDELRRSTENQTNVDPTARLYRAFLGRTPDAGGLKFWIGRRRSGKSSLSQMADSFAVSKEFTSKYGTLANRQFVLRIYTDVLGRTPDLRGVDYWTGKLDRKTRTRGAVMIGFSDSNEYKVKQANNTDVAAAYTLLLRRAPKATELSAWTEARSGGASHAQVLDELLNGEEYVTLVLQTATSPPPVGGSPTTTVPGQGGDGQGGAGVGTLARTGGNVMAVVLLAVVLIGLGGLLRRGRRYIA